MREVGLAESALGGTTGYGYDDRGREQIEQVYAHVFGAEAALVRLAISSGTQAISACLFGLLRPGDELLSVTGTPYDTLLESIGQPVRQRIRAVWLISASPIVRLNLVRTGVRTLTRSARHCSREPAWCLSRSREATVRVVRCAMRISRRLLR